MDHTSPIDVDADSELSKLGPWQNGLGVWLSAFLRVRHLRQAKRHQTNWLRPPLERSPLFKPK